MKTRKLLFYLLAGILGGCIPVMSLHPLYTEEDVVFEEKLVGLWVDDSNNTLEFKSVEKPENAYELVYSDNEGKKGSFVAHLVKLQNTLFLDIFPKQFPCKDEEEKHQLVEDKIILTVKVSMKWHYSAFFFVPFHTFIKINSIEPQLKMQLTDDEDMGKLLKENPNAVKHQLVEDKIILTASTKELQAFVLKYADDSKVFSKETVWSRKTPKSPNKPNDIDPNQTDPNDIEPNES